MVLWTPTGGSVENHKSMFDFKPNLSGETGTSISRSQKAAYSNNNEGLARPLKRRILEDKHTVGRPEESLIAANASLLAK